MILNIEDVLKKLKLKSDGQFNEGFYEISLADSDEYARMYTHLSEVATDLEDPSLGQNTAGSTMKVTNYFSIDVDGATYPIFLIADFENDKYAVRIGESDAD